MRPDDEWYDEQATRWNALEEDGWKFGKPPRRAGFIGMLVWHPKKPKSLRVFYVSRDGSFREIHAEMLEKCEGFAAELCLN